MVGIYLFGLEKCIKMSLRRTRIWTECTIASDKLSGGKSIKHLNLSCHYDLNMLVNGRFALTIKKDFPLLKVS